MVNSPTLEMLAGQMVMMGYRGINIQNDSVIAELLRSRWLGAVCLFDNDSPYGREINGNIASPDQVSRMTAAIHELSPITPLIAIDEEGGSVTRLKEKYGFIPTIKAEALGNENNHEFTVDHAGRIARQLKSLQINVNLAPDLDLKVNPEFTALGKRGRCISRDPQIAASVAADWIHAHHKHGILCTLKHFPGHGSAVNDSHFDEVNVTQTWVPDELLPFEILIKNDYKDIILTAHIHHDGLDPKFPATLSRKILTELLREKLGFQGVIITDDLQMDAIRKYYSLEQSIELALNAGNDMLVYSNVQNHDENLGHRVIDTMLHLVSTGRISEERLLESWRRITLLKQRVSPAQIDL